MYGVVEISILHVRNCRNVHTGMQVLLLRRSGPITAWTFTVNGMNTLHVYVLYTERYGHDSILSWVCLKDVFCYESNAKLRQKCARLVVAR